MDFPPRSFLNKVAGTPHQSVMTQRVDTPAPLRLLLSGLVISDTTHLVVYPRKTTPNSKDVHPVHTCLVSNRTGIRGRRPSLLDAHHRRSTRTVTSTTLSI